MEMKMVPILINLTSKGNLFGCIIYVLPFSIFILLTSRIPAASKYFQSVKNIVDPDQMDSPEAS